MKYLYGAAVQGIQQFIFQTNELKDIVGASELVESICTKEFEKLLKDVGVKDRVTPLINAAGNIKCEFENRDDCEKFVRVFPKLVVEAAPGITVSQAVVTYEDGSYENAVHRLEESLRKQRNKPMQSTTIGLMGIHRSRTTGLPAVKCEKGEYFDEATLAKRKAAQIIQLCRTAFDDETLRYKDVTIDPEDMTYKNDWVAVIHADGNGLGQVVQNVGNDRNDFREFSQNLDKATKQAAVEAYNDVRRVWEKQKIPIRPIVLGGDDFTVICRADIALEYATAFIRHFEKQTEEKVGKILKKHNVFTEGDKTDCLTACAGIAYVKSSYPFYYAYELAESLCAEAKKDAKKDLKSGELAPSCLMFHKVQDSFIEDYAEIVKRELTKKDVNFNFGPYYLDEDSAKAKDKWTVDSLRYYAKILNIMGKEGNAVKSHLRQWMTLLAEKPGMAEQKLKRLLEIVDNEELKEMIQDSTGANLSPVYDILAIHTINTQETKTEED